MGLLSSELTPIDKAKFVAAKQATEYVEAGMKVGLGTGSTAEWFVQCLGEMVREVETHRATGPQGRDRRDHAGRGEMAGCDR